MQSSPLEAFRYPDLSERNKKLSWCWQGRATHLEVSQGHQTWNHSIC